MMGVCVIVAYRPKPGKESELLELVRARVPTLEGNERAIAAGKERLAATLSRERAT